MSSLTYYLKFSRTCFYLIFLTKLICFLPGKVGVKDHQRFQASYATILKAHMTALKKRERKDKKKAAEADKKEGSAKKSKRA